MKINKISPEDFDQSQTERQKEEWLADLRACVWAAWTEGRWSVILRGLEIEGKAYGWLGNKTSQKPTGKLDRATENTLR